MPCCKWFGNSLKQMNDQGLNVVPRIQMGERRFVLRFSPVARHELEAFAAAVPRGLHFWSGSEVVVYHCPGCGADLQELIARNSEEFDRLVTQVLD